jgi:signal transduction histidine kinase
MARFFIIILIISLNFCNQIPRTIPSPIKGTLDLLDWEFEPKPGFGLKDGNINLDGEWEFYWMELIDAQNFSMMEACTSSRETCKEGLGNKRYLKIPSLWNEVVLDPIETESKNSEKLALTNIGYSTYRLKIINVKEKILCLYLFNINTSYKLFINGQLIQETGKVATQKSESTPSKKSLIYTFENDRDHIEIVLQVSNYFHRAGGTWEPFLLGKPENVHRELENRIISDIFICGVLAIMGIYHLGLYTLRKTDLSPLWFGLFCLTFSLRSLLTGTQYFYYLFPNMVYNIGLRLEYLTMYFGTPFFTLYFNTVFFKEKLKVSYIFIYGPLVLSLVVLLLDTIVFTNYLIVIHIIVLFSLVYGIYCTIKGVMNKTLGAVTFLIGFTIFALSILNDVLYANNILNIGLVSPIGLSIFIFSQSFLLSTKFSKAFSDSEKYAKDLKLLTENLEEKVRARTVELENEKRIAEELHKQAESALVELKSTQYQLIEAERMASLGQLVGGVAHEINNPIGVIRSNSELISFNIFNTIQKVPQFFVTLTESDREIFLKIINESIENKEFLTTKEERQKKKEIKKELESIVEESSESIEYITEQILLLKLKPPYKPYLKSLGKHKFKESLSVALIFVNQFNSITNIGIAVEKASRVIFALRSYLNTEMFLEKKEVNLISEIEKAIHLYDNYILGKVTTLRDFPKEIKFICTAENLSQVWNNIIFNAIQAMYLTEKKLQIIIRVLDEIPESILLMKSSLNLETNENIPSQYSKWILVSFIDSGAMIPENLQDKIFTPFFTTKALGEGIGLGLYVSKKIVHEHGGKIYFSSREGQTEFSIALPLV